MGVAEVSSAPGSARALSRLPEEPILSMRVYDLGVSANRGPQYSTLNSRILIIRIPK